MLHLQVKRKWTTTAEWIFVCISSYQQGLINCVKLSHVFEFHMFQVFQDDEEFQETATHFETLPSDSKSFMSFKSTFQEHISRALKKNFNDGHAIVCHMVSITCGASRTNFKIILSFKCFKRQQHISRTFWQMSRDIKSFKSFKSMFQEWLMMQDWNLCQAVCRTLQRKKLNLFGWDLCCVPQILVLVTALPVISVRMILVFWFCYVPWEWASEGNLS